MSSAPSPPILIIMGVAGVGKTVVGRAVAEAFGWAFADADAYHPEANVAKMADGEGLTDADRAPWLAALRRLIEHHLDSDRPLVLACSALKAAYRDRLHVDDRVRFIWLDVPRTVIARRLQDRSDHFAGTTLLPSQLATLEPPQSNEALRVDAQGTIEDTVRRVIGALAAD